MSQKCKRCGIMMVPRSGDNCSLCEAEIRRGASAQPAPIHNDLPAVWPIVIRELLARDMAERDATGRARYGVPLQPHNGRDTLRDLFEELLDAACYARALLYERDGK